MSETYQDIIREIRSRDNIMGISSYCDQHGLDPDDLKVSHQETAMALDIASRVCEAVSGDYRKWWMLDYKGNRVHLGDCVDYEGYSATVVGFKLIHGSAAIEFWDDGEGLKAVRTLIPESREKIIEDVVLKLRYQLDVPPSVMESIEEAVDRAMKLGAKEQ